MLYDKSLIIKWVILVNSFFIVALILWNTYEFSNQFKEHERLKIEIIAKTYERMSAMTDLDAEISLESKILENNHDIPFIITNVDGKIISWANLNPNKTKDKGYLEQQLSTMTGNNPILISNKNDKLSYIYYRNSNLQTKLKYYPLALIIILFLFSTVILLFIKSSRVAEQNKLWTGMAKETAHQIGTPLSSLLGWIELLRLENTNENIVKEMENDVERLNTIAERFSKIGSIPTLTPLNLVDETSKIYNYTKNRCSEKIKFSFETVSDSISVNLNPQLFSWVIENLIKNAIDAMDGRGKIIVSITQQERFAKISITDTGKGIPKHLYKKIFLPGYTTKKRGWGLGLSLTMRIINNFHKGLVYVSKSEINKGSTFAVSLRKN